MKIEKIILNGFGKLNNLSLDLKDGLNIIYGLNEAGKSSIQWFIKGAFYGLKGGRASRDGVLPSAKRFKPWTLNDYSGIIEYRLDNGDRFRVGRNFGTNTVHVFDALFNDITNTFDQSKEKGVQFAEKQLGMNEICFEKTVFIRQMETKVDEDGSRELINRLTNAAQTGFEDVSFRKAKDVLKEALKNYVGTDKTSTRPLDKVVSRLDQLGSRKNELIKKREIVFSVENDLKASEGIRIKLQNRKQVFYLLRNLLVIEKNIAKKIKLRKSLDEIINNITIYEGELTVTQKSVEEFNKTREDFEGFSNFNNDDIDNMWQVYYGIVKIKEANKRLLNDISTENAHKEKLERFRAKELKGFEELPENAEAALISLKREIEQLKSDFEKNNIEILNERIKAAEYKDSRLKYNVLASGVLTVLFLIIGVFKIPLGFAAAAIGAVTTILFAILKKKESRVLFELISQKKMSFVAVNSISNEIDARKKSLNKILSSVKSESLEEFLKLKALYDNNIKQISIIDEKVKCLEKEAALNNQEITRLNNKLMDTFKSAGIACEEDTEICEDDIKAFKYGVRRYDGSVPSIRYSSQRLEDINKSILVNMENASALCESKVNDINEIKEHVYRIDELLSDEAKRFSNEIKAIREFISEKQVSVPGFINLDMVLEEPDLENVMGLLEDEYVKLENEYNDTLLTIRECETLLRNMEDCDEEIQKIDEEMSELEDKKNQLHDINISLRTALEVLSEASNEIQRDFAPLLNQRMSEIIKRITNGRYSDLRADDNLSLKTVAPETGEVITAHTLSGGTVDQMYLSFRISMADLIAPSEESIPLIFDEVFAYYDDFRTREAFQFLKEMGELRQLVLFTCKGREVEIAREVFNERINIIEI